MAAFTSLSFAECPNDSGKISDKLFYPTVLIQRPFESRVLCYAIIEYLTSLGRSYLFRNNEHWCYLLSDNQLST
jgi:hypothetical protein